MDWRGAGVAELSVSSLHELIVSPVHGNIGLCFICSKSVVLKMLLEKGSRRNVFTVSGSDSVRNDLFRWVELVKVVEHFNKHFELLVGEDFSNVAVAIHILITIDAS